MTALAGFFGSTNLADEVHELAHILLQTWPQQVAAPIGNEIHNVLTQTRSGLLTIGVILAIYFSSSGVEAVRIGLNRAYDTRDSRSWWLLRLKSIAYIFVGAFALLTLAFLVVLAPLIWTAVLHFAPGFERSIAWLPSAVLRLRVWCFCWRLSSRISFCQPGEGRCATLLPEFC